MSQQRWKVRSLPIPRAADLGLARLVLAFVMQDGAYPDNLSDLALRLGTTRPTVRRWRDELVGLGLIYRVAGELRIHAANLERWKTEQARKLAEQGVPWTCDALPWSCVLRPPKKGKAPPKLTPRQMVAAAVMVGEAWSRKGYVRSDAERGQLAGVCADTVRQARAVLIKLELIGADIVRRGNAKRLAKVTWRRKASHGQALQADAKHRIAMRAMHGHAGVNAGPSMAERAQLGVDAKRKKRQDELEEVDTQPGAGVDTQPAIPDCPSDELRGDPTPKHEPKVPARSVCEEDKQKVSQQEQWGAKLKQVLQQAKPARSTTKKERNRQDIAAELFTDKAVAWIVRRDPRAAVTQLLLAAGAWDDAPKRRQLAADGLVVHYGKEAPTLLLAVIADSVLDDVRSLGAVVADRVGRLTNDKAQTTIRPERRSWGLSRLLRAAREHAEVA